MSKKAIEYLESIKSIDKTIYFDIASKEAKTPAERRTLRSKTFKGIAEAIAKQWGEFILNN